ncbi:hypothetical protein RHGRI_034453 [Rhododendron griersonianum]|uniref:Maturase K n=1 Tax=Rhododendron griersonianum TaxID=479676 RepID=A0AAV6I0P1_9ERIC|nr:hypothetical protein RHGRI_034453 [Rhododendron griersonianum]
MLCFCSSEALVYLHYLLRLGMKVFHTHYLRYLKQCFLYRKTANERKGWTFLSNLLHEGFNPATAFPVANFLRYETRYRNWCLGLPSSDGNEKLSPSSINLLIARCSDPGALLSMLDISPLKQGNPLQTKPGFVHLVS